MTESSPDRRASFPFFPVIVIVLVLALGVEAFLFFRPKSSRPREAAEAIREGASQQIETFGDPSAPFEIKFYAPLTLDWHQKTIGLLRRYDEDHPGRIYLHLMPMGNSKSDTEMTSKGFSCAVILINEENEFPLPDGRSLTLEKRPNTSTSTYDSEDVITVLDQLSAQGSS